MCMSCHLQHVMSTSCVYCALLRLQRHLPHLLHLHPQPPARPCSRPGRPPPLALIHPLIDDLGTRTKSKTRVQEPNPLNLSVAAHGTIDTSSESKESSRPSLHPFRQIAIHRNFRVISHFNIFRHRATLSQTQRAVSSEAAPAWSEPGHGQVHSAKPVRLPALHRGPRASHAAGRRGAPGAGRTDLPVRGLVAAA